MDSWRLLTRPARDTPRRVQHMPNSGAAAALPANRNPPDSCNPGPLQTAVPRPERDGSYASRFAECAVGVACPAAQPGICETWQPRATYSLWPGRAPPWLAWFQL